MVFFVNLNPDMGIIESLLTAISLCADCFAVSLCSSITIKNINWKNVGIVALSFAIIQALLLLVGYLFGNALSGLVSKVSHIIGFVLLLYVGISMIVEGFRGKEEVRDLNGARNIILGGIATSIDALAVGVSESMAGQTTAGFLPLFIAVFAVTFISVVAGIFGGRTLGRRFGRAAEIAGGTVLSIIAFCCWIRV